MLTDFDQSQHITEAMGADGGTLEYNAPERLMRAALYERGADMFSIG